MSTRRALFIAAIFLLAGSLAPARPAHTVRVGIVFDGPAALNQRFENELRREVTALFTDSAKIDWEPRLILTGDWTLPTVRANLDKLLNDRAVTVVIAAGVVASNELAHRRHLTKMAFAPFLLDPALQKPSGARSLSVIYGISGIFDDLKSFHHLVPNREITVSLDSFYWTAVPELKKSLSAFSTSQKIPLAFASAGAIPSSAKAIYLGPAPRLSASDAEAEIARANREKTPTFSFWGREALGQGALAAMGTDSEIGRFTRLTKRIASHLYRAWNGESPASLPSNWTPDGRLFISMATATAIGFHPNWETLRNAEAIGDLENHASRLSLENAVRIAVEANLELRAKGFETEADVKGVAIARSYLFPSLEAGLSAREVDANTASSSFGLQPEREADATATLAMPIFNERLWAGLSIQGDQKRVAEFKKEQTQLDIILQTSRAYLDCLRAQRMNAIQEADLASSRTNLTLAHERRSAGASSLIDVYRWESEVARSERQTNQAQAQLKIADMALSRLLHSPLTDSLILDDISYADSRFLYRDTQIAAFFSNPWDYRIFSDFLVEQAYANLPEVQAMDAAISAQERQVTSVSRQHWLPTFGLKAGFDERFWSSGAGSGPTQITVPNLTTLTFPAASNTQWNVGVQMTLPLFEGGRIEAERQQESARLEQYRAERGKVREEADRQVRSLLEELHASFSAIALSESESKSARESYRLVRDAYARGASQMTTLVDSQTAATSADQAAAVAAYDFLTQLIELQRAVARFDFLLTPDEKKHTLESLQEYFKTRGTHAPGL